MTLALRVAARFQMAKTFPGWTEFPGDVFPDRHVWRKNDGSAEVRDTGSRSIQRFQVMWIRKGKRIEGLGWPSLKKAILYAQEDIPEKEHPLYRVKPSDIAWNEQVRRDNAEFSGKKAKAPLVLSHYDLDGITEGKPVTLYHGTTKLFKSFDMGKSREELVNRFYGKGIFLTPSKRVAEKYADANRNIGFDPSIIADLKRKNPDAGQFLQALYDHGRDGWDVFWKERGFWRENPPAGEGHLDNAGFEKLIGVDYNAIGDLSGYIIGSNTKPLGADDDGTLNIFNVSTGAPSWVYDLVDQVGLNSKVYRPKVYTVSVTVQNPLVTDSKSKARSAQSKGFDSVVYYGSDLVGGVPEVAVFNPHNVKIKHIEVVS